MTLTRTLTPTLTLARTRTGTGTRTRTRTQTLPLALTRWDAQSRGCVHTFYVHTALVSRPPHISLYLAICRYISPYLPASPHISSFYDHAAHVCSVKFHPCLGRGLGRGLPLRLTLVRERAAASPDPEQVCSVKFHPDGTCLASASADSTIRRVP